MHDRERLARAVGFFVFKRTLKSAKTCGSVVLVFAVTYLPLWINSFVYESRNVPISLFNESTSWFVALVYLNCSINPLLYCAFSGNFRAVIVKTWRQLRRWLNSERFMHEPRSCRVSSFQQTAQQLSNGFKMTSVLEASSSLSVLTEYSSVDKSQT